jgi:hypothetical protein
MSVDNKVQGTYEELTFVDSGKYFSLPHSLETLPISRSLYVLKYFYYCLL